MVLIELDCEGKKTDGGITGGEMCTLNSRDVYNYNFRVCAL